MREGKDGQCSELKLIIIISDSKTTGMLGDGLEISFCYLLQFLDCWEFY